MAPEVKLNALVVTHAEPSITSSEVEGEYCLMIAFFWYDSFLFVDVELASQGGSRVFQEKLSSFKEAINYINNILEVFNPFLLKIFITDKPYEISKLHSWITQFKKENQCSI